ncbi:hypothetical protein LTR62_006171 [Meristemomyces frigidus]|uniref:Uncharacterized protein n=1 Tax=Meristemomyces frigidus TaxID=1508187 RepID=A0AAN7TCN1_9PEZI|nr:hypothetical protein LTR62_006171 [Meristemomyces frigidus]
MCYHKYVHYGPCKQHIPFHTHVCPKNLNHDGTRVIFCEDYQTVQVVLREGCPHCTPPPQKSLAAKEGFAKAVEQRPVGVAGTGSLINGLRATGGATMTGVSPAEQCPTPPKTPYGQGVSR